MEPADVARYPFLEASRDHVKARGISMSAISSDEFRVVHQFARQRLLDAVDGSGRPEMERPGDVEALILSYPLSRFIVSAIRDRNLVKWFSHREAEVAADNLENEGLEAMLSIGAEVGLKAYPPPVEKRIEPPMVLKGVRPSGDDLIERDRRSYWVRMTDYLSARSHITGQEWDLSNQRLVNGYIELNRRRYIRLVQELIKTRIESGLEPGPDIPSHGAIRDIALEIKARVDTRRKEYRPISMGAVTITRIPPCMRQALGMTQAGENLPHHARFALVAFLNAIGMGPEEIFKVFATSPDFKEDIVRYQIDHIRGSSSGTEYRVPGCETMKSTGICFNPDSLCEKDWMNSPYTYYRVKGKKKGGYIGR
ncbi:MAG: DNA primase large subunit PriL [Candidatus Thermoplasmatota archaeon]|nr:DNA primase large subunit PriL [Candidatus Thermoplasmatota archaeon]